MFNKLFSKLKTGLAKTRDGLTDKINEALKLAITIDDDLYDELEEILITSDVGMDTTIEIIDRLKKIVREEKINDKELVIPTIKRIVKEIERFNIQRQSIKNNQIQYNYINKEIIGNILFLYN